MNEAGTTAHLVDELRPEVRVRQWGLSFPYRIRFLLAFAPALCSAVRGILVRTILSAAGCRRISPSGVVANEPSG